MVIRRFVDGNPEGVQGLEVQAGDVADDRAGGRRGEPGCDPGQPEDARSQDPTNCSAQNGL
jgi:hypothetical protein